MSNSITAPITLVQNVINAPVTLGIVGEGGGGASTFAELTDATTADLPTINTPLATALAGKLATATAASTYAPINNPSFTGNADFADIQATGIASLPEVLADTRLRIGGIGNANITSSGTTGAALVAAATASEARTELGGLCAVTPGPNVATALAIAADATGGIFRQGQALSATTVTASGAVTVASAGIVTASNGNLNLSPNGTGYLNVGNRSYFGDGVAANSFQIVSGTSATLITTSSASIRTNSNSLIHNAAGGGGVIYFNRDVAGAGVVFNNTSSTVLMYLYPSGGLYLGSTPTDPGANNLRVQGTLAVTGGVTLGKTITAAGTTGARTINQTTGAVNFAAGATSLVVTNSLCTVNSVIICTVGTNDATMKSVLAVAAAGSFTIHANAAPTAETEVYFLLTN